MAVYTPSYPLTLPTITGIKQQTFGLQRAVSVTMSPFTYQEQVYQHEGERWSGLYTLPPMLKNHAAIWLSFLMKLRGRRGTFKAGDQDRKTIQGATVGTVLVNGAGQTGNSINVDGVGATVTGAFKAGDYITIQDRLYMVTDDANSNGSGEATLYIEPALRSGILAIADDATVLYTNTTALMRLDSNEQNWDTDHISKYGISFAFSEAL